jgi:hypothetical protein
MAEEFQREFTGDLPKDIQSPETLELQEQDDIDNRSIEAQKKLETTPEGIDFVTKMVRLRAELSNTLQPEKEIVTVAVKKPSEYQIQLVRQFLGSRINSGPDWTQKIDKETEIELYYALARSYTGRFLQIQRGRDKKIISAEVGFPVHHRLKALKRER